MAAIVLFAAPAVAQNPHQGMGQGEVSDVPPGPASIIGQLSHPDGNDLTEGATVVLYALASDGSPGMRTTHVDITGGFSFSQISNASGITYLIGASYRGVPYGERATFEAGQSELRVEIEVDDPSTDASRVTVSSSSLRLEWIGSSLGVEEIHQLDNPDDVVVYAAPNEREGAKPAFRTKLPAGAERIDTSLSGVSAGYETGDGELRFWGPIYGGGFELRFRYLIPIPRDHTGAIDLRWPLDMGSRDATVVFPPGGPTVSVTDAPRDRGIETGEGTLRSIDLGPVIRGRGIEMAVSLPAMSTDRSAISIPRLDYWLDADDTFLQVNVEANFEVAPGAHLAGRPDAPLLTFALPPGAEVLGASSEAQDLGVIPLEDGNLGVLGPLSPGKSGFAYRYRVAVQNGRPALDIVSPAAVGTLNVLIADNGVVIDTERLHRRRPFRQTTRVYLHREAFAVEEGEVVSIALDLIDRGRVDPRVHLFATSAFAALGVWFMVSPLARRSAAGRGEYERARIRSEREIVYQAIRDLEHDNETGKIETDEYETMRADLRTRGLELLQREKDATSSAAPADAEPAKQAPATQGAGALGQAPAAQGAGFCVQCGTALAPSWRFCANCGAGRPGAGETPT
jgi:hypothetical protein